MREKLNLTEYDESHISEKLEEMISEIDDTTTTKEIIEKIWNSKMTDAEVAIGLLYLGVVMSARTFSIV